MKANKILSAALAIGMVFSLAACNSEGNTSNESDKTSVSERTEEYIKLNMNFGISGPVTYRNGKNMKDVVENTDIKYLVSETDSPYLTPHPYRGKENGPKYIPLIVEEMAKIKNISINEMADAIEKNVNRIFRRDL